MSIMYRCTNLDCRTFYSYEHKKCPKCGAKSVNLYVSYREKGKLKFKSAGTKFSDAKDVEAAIRTSQDANAPATKRMLSDFVENVFIPYYNAKNKQGNEKINEQFILNITGNLPDKWLHEITSIDIENYLIGLLNRGLAVSTRNRNLALLAGMFNYATKMEYLAVNPVKSVAIKTDNTRRRYLSADEKKRLLDICKASTSKYLYPMVVVALNTGMRKGAIRHFKKEWIKDDIIQVPPKYSKSKDAYHIPLTAELKAFLNEIDELDLNHDVKKAWATAKKRAGIKNFRFHDNRHTFGSALASAGVSEHTISKLLGQTSTAMAKRYSHLSPDSILQAIHKIDKPIAVKICPDCAEDVKKDARICRYCGHTFASDSDKS